MKIPIIVFVVAVAILAVGTVALAGEIRIDAAGGSTVAYIDDGGRVEDSSRTTIGYINSDGRVENASRTTIAYIESGRIENASRSTIYTYSGLPNYQVIGAYIFFFGGVGGR